MSCLLIFASESEGSVAGKWGHPGGNTRTLWRENEDIVAGRNLVERSGAIFILTRVPVNTERNHICTICATRDHNA